MIRLFILAASKTSPQLSARLEILLNGHFQKLRYLQEAVEETIFDLKFKNNDQLLDKLDSVKNRLADHILAYEVAIKLYSEFYFAKYRLNIAMKDHRNIKFIHYRSNWIEARLIKLLNRRDRAGARVRRRDRQISSGKIRIPNENDKYHGSSNDRNDSSNLFMESIKQQLYVDAGIQDNEIGYMPHSDIDRSFCTQNQLFSSEHSATIGFNLNTTLNQSQFSEMNPTSDFSPKSLRNTPTDIEPCFHHNEVYTSVDESCENILTPSSQPIFGSELKNLSSIYSSNCKMMEGSEQIASRPTEIFSNNDNHIKLLSNLHTILFKCNLGSNIIKKPEELVTHCNDNRYFIASSLLYPKEFDFCFFDSFTSFILNRRPRLENSVCPKRINNLPKYTKHPLSENEFQYICDDDFLTSTLKDLSSTDSDANLRIEILKLLQTMPNYIPAFIYPINKLFGSDKNILVRYEAMRILITFSQINDEILYFSIKVFSLCNLSIQFDLLRNYRIHLPILNVLSSQIHNNFKKCLQTLLHNDLEEISIESLLLLSYYFPSLEYSDLLSSTLLSNTLQQYCLPISVFIVKYLKPTDSVLFFILSNMICDDHEINRIEIAKLVCLIQPTDWSSDLRKYCYSILSKLLWEDPSRFVRDQIRQTILEIGVLDDIIAEKMMNLDSANELIKLRAIKSFGSLREINSLSIARLLEILEIDASPIIKLQTIRTLSILSLHETTLQSVIIEKSNGDGYIALEAQKVLKYY